MLIEILTTLDWFVGFDPGAKLFSDHISFAIFERNLLGAGLLLAEIADVTCHLMVWNADLRKKPP